MEYTAGLPPNEEADDFGMDLPGGSQGPDPGIREDLDESEDSNEPGDLDDLDELLS